MAANPSVDRLFAVERLVPGEIHRPAEFVQVPGGKGLNVARAAAALGGDVCAAALLGGHAGRWIADQFEADGIDLRAVWAHSETRSSLSVAGAIEGLTEFYEHGTAVSDPEWAAFAALIGESAPQARWMTLSGSLPPGAPAAAYLEMIPLARAALDSRAPGIQARPALVKVNAAEASTLSGARDPLAAARLLQEATGGVAVVTRGEDGAVMVTAAGAWEGRLDQVGRYPVGSGDAFLAGMVVALDGGTDWQQALRLALGAGAANAAVPGAGRLRRAEAERLAERAVVASL